MGSHNHAHLTGEKPGNHRIQMLLVVVFLIVWIIDSFLVRFTTFLFNMIVVWLCVPLGAVIFLSSLYFMNASHHDIFDSKAEGVVTEGVYGRVRHPMYLGTFLVYLALAIMTLSIASILVWIIAVAYYNTLAIYEENLLIERFGDDYLVYKKNVRRWIPL